MVRTIVIGVVATVLAFAALAGCQGENRTCSSDDDCPSGQHCLAAGGVVFGGGQCIETKAATEGDDVTMADVSAPDMGRDTTSTVRRDTHTPNVDGSPVPDADEPPDTSENCKAKETCQNDVDDDCDDVIDEGCVCSYQGKAIGVCAGQTRNDSGECPKPANFETTEVSCNDKNDNDCDGAGDFTDDDCPAPPGFPCSKDSNRRSVCAQSTGTCAHRVFVTSRGYDGDFGGLSQADSLCNQNARSAGLDGTWKAILSTRMTAVKSRLTFKGAVVNMQNELLARNENDLWDGNLRNPVRYDENGSTHYTRVWTGSNADGTNDVGPRDGEYQGDYCDDDWSSDLPRDEGEAGRSRSRGESWMTSLAGGGGNDPPCDNEFAFYCIDGQ